MNEGRLIDQLMKGPLAADTFIRGKQPAPSAATDTTTLTSTQLSAGIIVATPTAAATYTLPTGTVFEGGIGGQMVPNDCMDCTIINNSTVASGSITLAGASGMTLLGSVQIAPVPATALTSGTLRIRKTATNTYTAYRKA